MSDDSSIAVIGLGLMGTAIAERLLEHGRPTVVWNRTREKADRLISRGARWSDRPLAECRRAIVSLYDSGVVAEVLGAMADDLRPGAIVVDTTTGEPGDVVAIAQRLAAKGVIYIDAPISGSSEQTRRGEATVLVGGPPETFAACGDLWPILGGKTFHIGPVGAASKMKLVTNLVLGLNRAALAEGLAFARSIGVEPAGALEVLRQSAAYSRQMDTKGVKMVERDFRPQAKLSQHLKDVRLMLAAGEAAGLELPLSRRHRELLEQAEAAGLGELDNSAIAEVYPRP